MNFISELFLLLLGIASVYGQATPQTCDIGYTLESKGNGVNTCMRINNIAGSWATQRSRCVADGATLLETTYDLQLALAVRLTGGTNYFVGCSDAITEGVWIWDSDGSRIDPEALWGANSGGTLEPDGGTSQNCCCLCHPTFLMCSCICNDAHFGICQKIPNVPPPTAIAP